MNENVLLNDPGGEDDETENDVTETESAPETDNQEPESGEIPAF